MTVLSMMSMQGDTDELVTKMAAVEEVAQRKAKEYGGISSTVVRTDDGIMIVNLWENEEGRHKMGEDPEIQEALRSAGLPAPSFKGYEVLRHRTVD